jgi:branched-chain amino acid transport system permease protein
MNNQDTANDARQALWVGFLGGIVTMLFSLVGMVTVFNLRAIVGTLLTLGQVFVLGTLLITGYAAGRRVKNAGNLNRVFYGGLAGAVSGAVLGLLAVLSSAFNIRAVFINASPELVNVLTFGQPAYIGGAMLTVIGAVIGALGAALFNLKPVARGAIIQVITWVVLVGLLADLIRVITEQWGSLKTIFRWMFSGKGLSVPGAVAVAVLSLVIYFINVRLTAGKAAAAKTPMTARQRWMRTGLLGALLLLMPPVLGVYMSEVLDQVGQFALMGLGLNIVVGFAGLLDLGYVAFFAIGAYTMGVLTSPEVGLATMSWWAALPIAVLVAMFFGVILGIPVLRMRGDYLAIVTLGFGEIIQRFALSDLLKPYIGGSQGIQLIAKPTIGSFVFDNQQSIYYLFLFGALLAAFMAYRLRDSRIGRAWMAMREDEDVAQAMGINLVATKLMAFATGAAFSGLSGAIFAAKLGSIYPHSFGLLISINVLALIIIGGMGSIPGVILGSLVLVGLPELLREFAEFRLLVYGALLVMMMLYKPEGLRPEESVRRELHIEEDDIIEEEPAPAG